MGFREDWQVWQEQQVMVFQRAVSQMRERWQGRRVWIWTYGLGEGPTSWLTWQYAWVESVDDRGWVKVVYGYEGDRPVSRTVGIQDLGRVVVLAE